jgi:hypothetical protein
MGKEHIIMHIYHGAIVQTNMCVWIWWYLLLGIGAQRHIRGTINEPSIASSLSAASMKKCSSNLVVSYYSIPLSI